MLVNKNIVGKHQYVLPYVNDYRHKLDVIQNYYPHHKEVIDAINVPLHEYSYHDQHYNRLIELISRYIGSKPENIILTNGSDNALKALIEAFVTPEAKVAVPVPTYPHFISFLDTVYNTGVIYPRVCEPEDLAGIDFNGVNVCYLTTPNLPIGYTLDITLVETLAHKYPKTLFIVDEAYHEYGGGASKVGLAITLDNVIVTRTFSKAFGLAGLRIGYIVAKATNVNLIRPLINEKNVTSAAIRAAKAVLENLPYYQNQIEDIEDLKLSMSWTLDAIVGDDLPIYGYSIRAGNFFLLFSGEPQKVCDIFAEHGIMVRNKHSDVPNAIRVCMGPRHIMDDVISVCIFINMRRLLQGGKVIFDLDMTLRNGAKTNSPLLPGAEIVNKVDSIIVTNNNQTPERISEYFARNGLHVGPERIVTSLSAARGYITRNGLKVYVYGNKEYFADVSATLDQCSCILLASIDISMRDIVDICRELSRGKILLYTDPSESCSVNNSSEFDDMGYFEIPDMQSIIKMIRGAGYHNVRLIGKPNMELEADVVVGDSATDNLLAKNIGATFILVGALKNRFNFDRKHFRTTGVGYLNGLF